MDVSRACIEITKNLNVCISWISRPIELEVGIKLKPKCPFLQYIVVSVEIDSRFAILWERDFM